MQGHLTKPLQSVPYPAEEGNPRASKLILPVEDERIVGRDLQIRLKRLGYEVPAIASSKVEAMRLVKDFQPDLVLMDITLNGTADGIEAGRQIRERFDVPVIYLTAHSDSDTLEKAKLTEPFGYVLKPFEDRELMAGIEMALHKHEAERRLRRTERWLAATLCSLGDGVITTDPDLRVTFLNWVAEELTGWTASEAIGQDLFTVFQLSGERAGETARDCIANVLSSGLPATLESSVLLSKPGNAISVSNSIAPILDERGYSAGIVLAFRDVTEKERAEQEIRERGEQQAAANSLTQQALAGLDLQILADEACSLLCRLLHADVAEFLELDQNKCELRTRSCLGAADRATAPALSVAGCVHARQLLERTTPGIVHRTLAGDPFLDRHGAESAAAVIVGTPEKPFGILAVCGRTARRFSDNQLEFLRAIAYTLRSALERNAMEKRLRETEQMESIGVLAGGIAHDFNNLLAVVMGQAEEGRRECPQCPIICDIWSAAGRAADLTRQLLAYAGKGHVISAQISLSDWIAESREMLQRALPERVRVEFALAAGLPPVQADPAEIRQILISLISNAGEAIPPGKAGHVRIATGGVDLTAGRPPAHSGIYSSAPGRYAFLEVADDGCGISEAIQERIFEPFFSTKFTGRGLGLAAVQGIVRAYGGFIQVESAPGSGATFRIFLPARPENASPNLAPAEQPLQKPASHTVLVIEDEAMLRKMVVRMLERAGFRVLSAGDGKAALVLLEQTPSVPAVALVDLTMPVMGAAELLPVLRSRYPALKVIATSGYSEQEACRVLRPEYISGFLQKPFERDALCELLARTLN